MNKEEKIEVIREVCADESISTWRRVAEKILDALEEKPAPTFRQNEIVYHAFNNDYHRFGELAESYQGLMTKIAPAKLAATVAIQNIPNCQANDRRYEVNLFGELFVEGRHITTHPQWADLPDAEKEGEIK